MNHPTPLCLLWIPGGSSLPISTLHPVCFCPPSFPPRAHPTLALCICVLQTLDLIKLFLPLGMDTGLVPY